MTFVQPPNSVYTMVERFASRLARDAMRTSDLLEGTRGSTLRNMGAAQRRLDSIETTLREFDAYLGAQPAAFEVRKIWGTPLDAVPDVRRLSVQLDDVSRAIGTRTGAARLETADFAGFGDAKQGASDLLSRTLGEFIFL